MFRYTVFFGVILGMAGGIPALYQSHKTEINTLIGLQNTIKTPTVAHTQSAERRVKHDLGRVVRIPMDHYGHFNAKFKMNGRLIPALVDTGATYIAINRSTARRIGVKIKAGDFKYTVNTANGRAPAATAHINEVAIGKIRVRNVPVLIMHDKALNSTLLGMSFLKQLKSFTIVDRELVLEQ